MDEGGDSAQFDQAGEQGSDGDRQEPPPGSNSEFRSLAMELEDAEALDSDSDSDEADGRGRQPTSPNPGPGDEEHPERPPYRGMSPPPLSYWGEEGLAEERRIKEEVAKEAAEEAEELRKRPKRVPSFIPPEKAPKDTFPTQSDLELARPIIGVLKQMVRWYDAGEHIDDDELLRAAIHESAAEERVNSVFAGMLKQDRRIATFRAFQKAAIQVPYSHGFSGDGSKLARAILAVMPMPGSDWPGRDKKPTNPYRDAATSPTTNAEEETRASKEVMQQLADEKKELEEQLKKLQDDAEGSELAMQKLTSEKGLLEEKLEAIPSDANKIIERLTSDKKDLEEKLKQGQDAFEESATAIQKLTSEKGLLEENLKGVPSDANKTIERLTNDKKDLEEKLKQSKDTIEESTAVIQQFTKEKGNLESKLENEKQGFESKIESQKKDLKEKLKAFENDTQASADMIQQLTGEKQDLERKLKTCRDSVQKSDNAIKKLTSDKESLEQKLEKATEDDGSDLIIRQLADEKADLDDELERYQNDMQQLRDEKRALEIRLEDEREEHDAKLDILNEGHEKRLKESQDNYRQFLQDTEEDRRGMEELHAQRIEAVEGFKKEKQVLEDAVTKLENEKKDVRAALRKYEARNATLREEIQNLQQEIEKSKERVKEVGESDADVTEVVRTSPAKTGYEELLQYYTRSMKAISRKPAAYLWGVGGNKSNLYHVQANIRASFDATKDDAGNILEEFAELHEYLYAAILQMHTDDQLLRALSGVSLDYQKFNFAELAAAAAGPGLSSPSSLALQQRLLAGANNLNPLAWLNLVSFLFFVAATLAEGSKYAQWKAANATTRALYAENRAYVCVSAPHMAFFVEMVREMIGIRRSS
ncbi:uncharacterized protein PG998_012549 [Apiospora kogelbergensis]|uniref:uncharacterized protein n=1 Tax=Apiospora kogelbergensis TaxID=1337665 RepID=UPI00312F06B8